MTEATEVITPEVLPALQEQVKDLEPATAKGLVDQFKGFFAQVDEYTAAAKAIEVTDATQVSAMGEARDLRLKLRKVRTTAENQRKEMKAESLRMGRAIDGAANILKAAIVPLEEKLLAQEEFAKRIEAQRIEDMIEKRNAAIEAVDGDPSMFNTEEMTEPEFIGIVEMLKAQKQERIDEAKRVDDERLAKEQAEREEKARKDAEIKRLKEEAEAQKKKEAAELKARQEAEAKRLAKEEAEQEARKKAQAEERRQHEEEMRVQREKAEAAQREADAKIEAERKAREEAEAKAQAEREAAEKAKRDAEAKAQAEKDAEAARLKKEDDEKAAAEKKAAQAPDKEKALAWMEEVFAVGCENAPLLDDYEVTHHVTNTANAILKIITEAKEALNND